MKKKLLSVLIFFLGACLCSQAANAEDCPGPWSILPNWDGYTAPCRQLGLDTHQGVCQPGQAYETLCDDAKGGRYKICQGPRPCDTNVFPLPPAQNYPSCYFWDYTRNQPCPPGYINHDCRGDCGPAR